MPFRHYALFLFPALYNIRNIKKYIKMRKNIEYPEILHFFAF